MGSRSSTTDRGLPETVLVGCVRRPHGVRGEVVVEVFTDVAERFAPGSELLAVAPEASPGTGGGERLRVAAARSHRGLLLVGFEGRQDRAAAEELRGVRLEAEPVPGGEPPEGGFYHYQLVGCRCHDLHRGELGEVVDVVEDGGGLLLIVEGGGRRLPVPFVARFLGEIDVAGRRIEMDLPPGLVETCASRS